MTNPTWAIGPARTRDGREARIYATDGGGERVYLNEAMTRAIALYQAQASGRSYECLFSDESDGALDKEKKRQYARMKQKVREIGGYRREFMITHSDEVRESADATIDVGALRAA
jgi:exonuclease SbcC